MAEEIPKNNSFGGDFGAARPALREPRHHWQSFVNQIGRTMEVRQVAWSGMERAATERGIRRRITICQGRRESG
jgi:hypothetical protein